MPVKAIVFQKRKTYDAATLSTTYKVTHFKVPNSNLQFETQLKADVISEKPGRILPN